MTKLNLLGAQRVKALTEILERKFSDKIQEVQKERIGPEEASKLLAEKIGLTNLIDDIKSHEQALYDLRREAENRLGISVEVTVNYRPFHIPDEIRTELNEVSDNGVGEKVTKLKRELEERKSQLWLVETLEEAQKIVNGDIKL